MEFRRQKPNYMGNIDISLGNAQELLEYDISRYFQALISIRRDRPCSLSSNFASFLCFFGFVKSVEKYKFCILRIK